MRKCLFLILVLIVGRAHGQQGVTAIKNLLAQQTKAWNRGDLEGFMQTYWKSDSLLFIGKNGITKGWTRTLENYRKGYPDKAAMGNLSFDIIKITLITPEDAFVIGKWMLNRTKGDVSGHYSLLLKKIGHGRKWQRRPLLQKKLEEDKGSRDYTGGLSFLYRFPGWFETSPEFHEESNA